MKRVLLPILILPGLVFLFAQCTSKDEAVHKKLRQMATNLNKSGPVPLDECTRFDSAGVSADNVFYYYYTIMNAADPHALVNDMKGSLDANLREAFATNPDLAIFKKNNLTIEYVYRNEAGTVLESLKITPDKYK